jgi:gas vesicle protein
MTDASTDQTSSNNGDSPTLAKRFADTSKRLQDQAGDLMDTVKPRIEAVTTYAKEEPMKTLLIAAACGAVVMGIVTLAARSGGRDRTSVRGLRRMAQDAADTAARMAHDTIDRASSAASSAAKSGRDATQSGRDAASSAFDGLSDTVKNWKEQAAPYVERFQPQIDSVTAFAKNEPAKSAMLVAAAGALLAGLVTLANQSDD